MYGLGYFPPPSTTVVFIVNGLRLPVCGNKKKNIALIAAMPSIHS